MTKVSKIFWWTLAPPSVSCRTQSWPRPPDRHSPAQMEKQFHLGEASHAPFPSDCEPSFALSFSPPFQSQFSEQIFLQNIASWLIPPPVKFLMQKPSHRSDPEIRPPPPQKRRVRALPLLCVTLPRPSAISLHNFRQWSAMDPEHQSQPMVFRTPLKPQADRFLQKREDWIRKNSASLSPNSENWNRQALFAGQIRRGRRRYTWYQNQTVPGDHAATTAG